MDDILASKFKVLQVTFVSRLKIFLILVKAMNSRFKRSERRKETRERRQRERKTRERRQGKGDKGKETRERRQGKGDKGKETRERRQGKGDKGKGERRQGKGDRRNEKCLMYIVIMAWHGMARGNCNENRENVESMMVLMRFWDDG